MAKWVLPVEPDHENAFKLKENHVTKRIELFAPTILTIEVTNALWKAVRLKRLPQEDAQVALKTLGDIKIKLLELDWADTSEILKIAIALDLAVYDATYLFLTRKIKAHFITSDNKLYEKAKNLFEVLHLKDYPTNTP